MSKKLLLFIYTILSFFISSTFTPAICGNINEIKSEILNKKSAKLQCSCEYRLSNININWWENFSDEYLKEYIYLAITQNHNLKKAALKSEEYRQMVNSTLSNELPKVTFSPTFARIKTAGNQLGDIEFAQTRSNIYALPLVAQYEADIFLKNHDKTKAQKYQKEAIEYEEKAANITTASDVATLYINIIKLDKAIKTKEEITKIRQNIYELTKDRNKAGLASVYDVTYTDKQHTQSQIELNDLKRQQNIYLHELAVYIDECPTQAYNLKRGNFDNLEFKGKIPECISSETIALRPDIMQTEAKLKKAKIDINIAKKEFLPTIPILGVTGYNTLLLKRLFNWESIIALVGVSAFEKIYTGGYLMANLRIKKIQFQQLLEEYKQTDLNAIQEISDCLCLIKYDTQKDNNNLKKIKLEKNNLKLIEERYKAGIISYLEYIQYKENLLSLEIDQCNSKAQRLIDYISLYKATGCKL